MKIRTGLLVVLASMLLMMAYLAACAPSGPKQKVGLKFASTTQGSSQYQWMSAWITMINRYSTSVQGTLSPAGGFVGALDLTQKGENDVAQLQTWGLKSLMTGQGQPWEGHKAYPEARVLFGSDTTLLHFMVRQDSKIQTVADLKGKRIGSLDANNASHWTNLGAIEALGYKPGDVNLVDVPSADLHNRFKEGAIDGFLNMSSPGAAAYLDTTNAVAVKFLDIPATAIAKMNETFGTGSFTTDKIKAGIYKGMDKDVTTFGAPIVTMASTRMTDDVAYEITKQFFEHQKEATEIFAGCGLPTPEFASQKTILANHPGALKYFKEKGWIK